MAEKISFEAWKYAVDRFIGAKFGLSSSDLPDCNYRSWYDSGMSAASAAKKAIKQANE